MISFFKKYVRRVKEKGFTLIETLVAVTMITLAIGGPFAAAEQDYVAALDSTNRLTASYLAQQGIEYVRLMRDNTFIQDAHQSKANLSSTAYFDDFLNQDISSVQTSVQPCRDTNGDSFAEGGTVYCSLDPDTSLPEGVGAGRNLQLCSGDVSTCPPLYVSSGGFSLSSSNGTATSYRRGITFYDVGGDASLEEVQVTVTWDFHGKTHSIQMADYLTPWQ